jgi:ribosome biogenesis protein BMS1
MGVCTHLDHITRAKALSTVKKQLKHRFWTEIYQGAKMHFFSGVVHGKYLKHETKLLTMHISRLKFRPLTWRNQHPYLLVDRVEDVTHPDVLAADRGADRSVVFYGYVRGAHLNPSSRVHLIGVGDFALSELEAIPDPCPLPEASSQPGAKGGTKQRQTLRAKEVLLYAPMSNLGTVKFDHDATYIDLARIQYTKPDMLDVNTRGRLDGRGPGPSSSQSGGLLRSLQEASGDVDLQLESGQLTLFGGDATGKKGRGGGEKDGRGGSQDWEEGGDDDDDDEDDDGGEDDDDDDEGEDDEDGAEDDEEDEEDEDDDEEDNEDEEVTFKKRSRLCVVRLWEFQKQATRHRRNSSPRSESF